LRELDEGPQDISNDKRREVDFLDIYQSEFYFFYPEEFVCPAIFTIDAESTGVSNLIPPYFGDSPYNLDPVEAGKYKRDRRFTFINQKM
jgi:hypothetical protein